MPCVLSAKISAHGSCVIKKNVCWRIKCPCCRRIIRQKSKISRFIAKSCKDILKNCQCRRIRLPKTANLSATASCNTATALLSTAKTPPRSAKRPTRRQNSLHTSKTKKGTHRRSRWFFIYGRSPRMLAACKGTHDNLPPALVLTKPPVNGHYLPNMVSCSPSLSSSSCFWIYALILSAFLPAVST